MKRFAIRYKLFFLFSLSFVGMLILAERSFAMMQANIDNTTMIYDNFKDTQNIQENYMEPTNALREMSLSLVMSPNGDY